MTDINLETFFVGTLMVRYYSVMHYILIFLLEQISGLDFFLDTLLKDFDLPSLSLKTLMATSITEQLKDYQEFHKVFESLRKEIYNRPIIAFIRVT